MLIRLYIFIFANKVNKFTILGVLFSFLLRLK